MKKYNAIIFYKLETNKKVRKYRNITNLEAFIKFIMNTDAWYCNLYDAKNQKFIKRIYLDYLKKALI